jgi:hypothetical protein
MYRFVIPVAAGLSVLSGCAGGASTDPTSTTQSPQSTPDKQIDEGRFDIDCPAQVPASIVPPAGNKLKLALHVVRGTQDYACVNGAFVLQNPEAILRNGHARDNALHFFGAAGSPLFVSDRDSSEVNLKKSAATPAPGAGAVAWLLLETVAVADAADGKPGLFSDVTFVQRLNTQGGNPPPGACSSPGVIVKVPYAADYFFYEKGEGKVCR